MILALLLAAATSQTAVDAERAFAADAQTQGQWTAFRKWAASDAIMFIPQPTNAHEFLKNLPDPKLTYQWWPAKAFVSCDGRTAVTTGPALRGNYRGYFTTVWQKQPDGEWKWVLDHGDGLTQPRTAGAEPVAERASCVPIPKPKAPLIAGTRDSHHGVERRYGWSEDYSLSWSWIVKKDGSRTIAVELWDGARGREVLRDEVAASQP